MQRLDMQADWQRVSPKYVLVVLAGSVLGGLLAAAFAVVLAVFADLWWAWIALGVIAAVTVAQAIIAPRRARSIGYALRQDDLLFRRGVLFQRFVSVPYGRMQLVDITRGPLSRALSLADLKFVTAAAATGVAIPGLPEASAGELRDRLVALAETRRAGL